jgi:lysozyme
MIFNIGYTRVLGFKKMLAAIKRDDYQTAAKEMLDSNWARQVGNRATKLAALMQG